MQFTIRHLFAAMTAIGLFICWLKWLDPDWLAFGDYLHAAWQEFCRMTPLPDTTGGGSFVADLRAPYCLSQLIGGACGVIFNGVLAVLSVQLVLSVAGKLDDC